MVHLISIGIDIISLLTVFIPVMIVLRITVFKQESFKRIFMITVFALYLSAVFSVVGIPGIQQLRIYPLFQWIPLVDIVNSPVQYIKNTLLNILMFVPLGCLLPLIWKEFRGTKAMFLWGLGLSLLIETMQIFTYRLTDVDDLITNTLGAVLGYGLLRLYLKKGFPVPVKKNPKKQWGDSPFLITAVVFLIQFIPVPFISSAIWEAVLSSSLWEMVR